MKNLLFTAILLVTTSSGILAQDVELIVERYNNAIGGEAFYTDIESIKISGTMQQMSMEFPIVSYQDNKGRSRTEFSFQGQTMLQIFDGEKGWSKMPGMSGALEVQEIPKEQLSENSTLRPEFNDPDNGKTVEYAGQEEFDGTNCEVLTVTAEAAEPVKYYFDVSTGLLLGTSTMSDESPIHNYITDYKEVDGFLFPFSMRSEVNGQVLMTFTYDSIEMNVPIDDSMFEKPE